jgi:hypothetical protein
MKHLILSKQVIFILFVAFLFAGCDTPAKKVEAKEDQYENILFIGNSYTYRNGGVDYHLRNLSTGMKGTETTYVTRAAKGKYHLNMHWSDSKTWLKLISKKWDKVILQEYSMGPLTETKKFMRYGKKWGGRLMRMNPATQIYLFSTWGYKESNFMTDSIYNQYSKLESEINASTIPVGLMWKDLKNKVNLYDSDGAHPNWKGTFISACLFYEHIYKKDVRETTNNDIKLSIEMQTQLKEWAHGFYKGYQDHETKAIL